MQNQTNTTKVRHT